MSLAIVVTCLLIEADEKGVKLTLQTDGKLKVTIPNPSPSDLLDRLKGHKDDIVERLRHDKINPCPFVEFFDKVCLFYPGERISAPEGEILAAYCQWANKSNQQFQPLKLKRRLKEIGCENIEFQGRPRWEHVIIWGEVIPLNKQQIAPNPDPEYQKVLGEILRRPVHLEEIYVKYRAEMDDTHPQLSLKEKVIKAWELTRKHNEDR